MTDEHPNATAYRRTADAFRSGDDAELAALIADGVVWHVPGSHYRDGLQTERWFHPGDRVAWEQIFAD